MTHLFEQAFTSACYAKTGDALDVTLGAYLTFWLNVNVFLLVRMLILIDNFFAVNVDSENYDIWASKTRMFYCNAPNLWSVWASCAYTRG